MDIVQYLNSIIHIKNWKTTTTQNKHAQLILFRFVPGFIHSLIYVPTDIVHRAILYMLLFNITINIKTPWCHSHLQIRYLCASQGSIGRRGCKAYTTPGEYHHLVTLAKILQTFARYMPAYIGHAYNWRYKNTFLKSYQFSWPLIKYWNPKIKCPQNVVYFYGKN